MKKMFAVLCGCMMIVLAACGGKTTTDETKDVNLNAAATNEKATASTSTLTGDENTVSTEEPAIKPAAETSVEPTQSTEMPTSTAAAVTPFPDPIREEDSISAKDFLEFFTALGEKRSESRVNELKERFDGRMILEDNALYIAYLDLATLPETGFEVYEDGWYRWNGDDEEYSFYKGIIFTEEEYNASVLEIEVREAVAYGTTSDSDSKGRDGYWLYFRNYESVDIDDYTIYRAGLGEEVDQNGGITDAKLYYREYADCEFDLAFELVHMVPALGDGRTYRVSTHVSVLNTMTEVCNDEYYVDTVMKECDNAEDGSKSTVSADFGDIDL